MKRRECVLHTSRVLKRRNHSRVSKEKELEQDQRPIVERDYWPRPAHSEFRSSLAAISSVMRTLKSLPLIAAFSEGSLYLPVATTTRLFAFTISLTRSTPKVGKTFHSVVVSPLPLKKE